MSSLKLIRLAKNPILSPIKDPAHWWEARSVCNAGVVSHKDRIYMLYRAMGQVHYSNFGLAILSDPTTVEKRLDLPVFEPGEENKFERFGAEDPRIVRMDNTFYVVYTAASIYQHGEKGVTAWDHMTIPWRIRCSLAQTDDFIHYNRLGVILPDVDTKNGTLFPEKINGKYALLHRIFPDMWISYSDNITHFKKGEILARPRAEKWDSERIGAGAPPIKTDLGWLLFYHGVSMKQSKSSAKSPILNVNRTGFHYSMGIMLLDLHNPKKILYRSKKPILIPKAKYEREGYVNNVVFTCGAIDFENVYYIYYGAADTRVAVASIGKDELLEQLKLLIRK